MTGLGCASHRNDHDLTRARPRTDRLIRYLGLGTEYTHEIKVLVASITVTVVLRSREQ